MVVSNVVTTSGTPSSIAFGLKAASQSNTRRAMSRSATESSVQDRWPVSQDVRRAFWGVGTLHAVASSAGYRAGFDVATGILVRTGDKPVTIPRTNWLCRGSDGFSSISRRKRMTVSMDRCSSLRNQPDVTHDLSTRQDTIGVLDEVPEQLHFHQGQLGRRRQRSLRTGRSQPARCRRWKPSMVCIDVCSRFGRA